VTLTTRAGWYIGSCPGSPIVARDPAEKRCPLGGTAPAPVDAVDHAVEDAHHQRADVVVFCQESAGLHEHRSIAALLHG